MVLAARSPERLQTVGSALDAAWSIVDAADFDAVEGLLTRVTEHTSS
jgi:short subunit dehydrogenase-like uncharacterized protein